MNPQENLTLAQFLMGVPRGAPTEASLRAACGRAYYYAFAIARDLLLGAQINVPQNGDAHRVVIQHLKRSSDRDVKSAALQLDNLRTVRNRADYEVGARQGKASDFLAKKVQIHVVMADAIVNSLVRVRASDPRLGIR